MSLTEILVTIRRTVVMFFSPDDKCNIKNDLNIFTYMHSTS